jgi:hypothetical protein
MSSKEDLREAQSSSVRSGEVGDHLRGLNLALEALAVRQQDKRSQLLTSTTKQVS